MAARTSDVLVKGLLMTDYDTKRNPPLDQFINSANSLVNRLAGRAAENGVGVTDGDLILIETWLAAHAYCMVDQPYSSRSSGGASGSFQGQTGMRLKATKYGQMALDLDPTGFLANLEATGTAVASMDWLGTEL